MADLETLIDHAVHPLVSMNSASDKAISVHSLVDRRFGGGDSTFGGVQDRPMTSAFCDLARSVKGSYLERGVLPQSC